MALSRGKKMTQTPSGSNIRVNVPDYAGILNAPINAVAEKVQIDERRDQLNFQREGINFQRQEAIKNAEITSLNNQKKEIIKADKEQQKLFEKQLKEAQDLKEAEAKAKADRIEAANEVAFLKHSTAMTNFAWELEQKHPNNPDAIVSQMEEYYNKITTNKENAVWLKDEKRFYKFFEKYSQLYRGAVGEATKKFDSFQEDQHWGSLTNYAEKLITNTEISIARIETEADIPQYLEQITQDINTLQNHMNSYDAKWGYKMAHTREEINQLMYNLISARDTKFISHIIDRFVLGDAPNQNNVDMAKALLEHIKQDKLPTAFEGDPRVPPDTYNMKSIYEVLSMISDYTNSSKKGTIDQYTPDDRNDIIDNISSSIDNAEKDYKDRLRKENINNLTTLEETTDRLLSSNSDEWVGNINSKVIPDNQLDKLFVRMTDEGFFVPDKVKIKEVKNIQSAKLAMRDLVDSVVSGEVISTGDIEETMSGIDMDKLELEQGNVNEVYKLAVEEAFGGEAFDPINLFQNIMQNGKYIPDENMNNGIAMMKKLNYWHPSLTRTLKNFETSEFENIKDAEFLVAFSMVKNKVLGTNDAIGLPENYATALDRVRETYFASKDYSQAALEWKNFINPAYSDVKAIDEGIDTWWKSKGEFSGLTGENQSLMDFQSMFNKANDRQNMSHIRYWTSLFTWGSWDEGLLDNIIANKHNNNMLVDVFNFISPYNITNEHDVNFVVMDSATKWMQNYVKNNMGQYLFGNKNPSEMDYQKAYESAFREGIKDMTHNNRFKFSSILYHPSSPNGFVLTENAPEQMIMNGMLASDPNRILVNAGAFVGKLMFDETDQNQLAFSVFGNTADYQSIEEKNALFRDFMAMPQEGRLKLLPVQDTKDLDNPAYHIMLDVDGDGDFIALTQNGKAVEWFPNTQYTDSPDGFTHDQMAQKWATDLIDGKTGIGSYNLESIATSAGIDIKNLSGEDRVDMIKILTRMIQTDDTFRGIFGSLLFSNDDVSGGDKNIDRITEFHSKLVGEFDDYRKTVHEQSNIVFDNDEDGFIFNHKSKYNQNLFEMENNPSKVQAQQEDTAIATETYNEIYGMEKSNITVPPLYRFVITDIIEATPNWKVLVGEGTRFHDAVMNEKYLDALDELKTFKSFMQQEGQLQRFNDLLQHWGTAFNRP